MIAQCVMCGAQIADGFLCEKCDRPRKSDAAKKNQTAAAAQAQAKHAAALDPLPKAPVVPFPIESTSPALSSIIELLATAHVAAIVLSVDRGVKFVSDEAAALLGVTTRPQYPTLKALESKLGFKLPDIRQSYSATIKVSHRPVDFSIVPLSGGAGGSVIILRPLDVDAASGSYVAFVRETVTAPLGALRDALHAGAAKPSADPLLADSASTIDQILSSLDLAPGSEAPKKPAALTISDSIRRVAERVEASARSKGVTLQADPGDIQLAFADAVELESVLGILAENALHYVPEGGQVVVGVRQLEHKGKQLLLFFTMDNGPIVPEELRESIFAPDFEWKPSEGPRTGRDLHRCRSFAQAHGGQIWVESKTGKACTFFLRIRV